MGSVDVRPLAFAVICLAPLAALGQDSGVLDAGALDAGGTDAGDVDAGETDAGNVDAGGDLAPPGWTCAPTLYDDGPCDCACGVIDEDCGAFPDVSDCERWDCPDGIVDGDDITICRTFNAPDTWTCPAFLYEAGGTCDCGCGALDPDCPPGAARGDCEANFCDPGFDVTDADITTCLRLAPPEWTCAALRFVDGECDCGCGAFDPECVNDTLAACDNEWCDEPDYVDPDDIGVCRDAVLPSTWNCNLQAYGDLICDCGCGAPDPDCPVPTVEDDCRAIGCTSGLVDESDLTACDVLPAEWTCNPITYNAEDRCNCECGAWDPDCDDPNVTATSCLTGLVCAEPGVCEEPPPPVDGGSADGGDAPPDALCQCDAASVDDDEAPSAWLAGWLVAIGLCLRPRRRSVA